MTRLHSQRGATLLVALIMLVLLTLFAISALRTSTTNLKVVGNMQARTEALNAAQQAIENVITTPLFTSSPAAAVLNPCDGTANMLCTDSAGNLVPTSATAVYTIRLNPQPSCVAVRAIKTVELNFASLKDQACVAGQAQMFGVAGAVGGDSLCAYSEWEVTAEATAVLLGARAAATQGIGIRISTDEMATACPTT